MTSAMPMTGWEGHADADVLHAVITHDLSALRELHRRYAPMLYALAIRDGHHDPGTRVQHVWAYILRHAHWASRSKLEARLWMLAMARYAP